VERAEKQLDVADISLAEKLVNIRIQGYQDLLNISADRVHQTVFDLEAVGDHALQADSKADEKRESLVPSGHGGLSRLPHLPHLSILCELSVVNGTKILHVHSLYGVKNHTANPLHLFGHRVEKNQVFWVPLQYCSDPEFSFTPYVTLSSQPPPQRSPPSSQAESVASFYEVSRPISLQFDQPTDDFAFCRVKHGVNQPKLTDFFVSVESSLTPIAGFGERILRLVELRPPLTIENLLATSVAMRVTNHSKGGDRGGHKRDEVKTSAYLSRDLFLGHECQTYVHECNPDDDIQISLSVPLFETDWSESMSLADSSSNGGVQNEVRQVTVNDKHGRSLSVCVEIVELDEDGQGGGNRPKKVVLYVPYWLFDMTELQLQVCEDRKLLALGVPL
jgi:hypothetical protein